MDDTNKPTQPKDDKAPAATPENAEIKKIKEDADRYMNNWRRAQADFENYKKQKSTENDDLVSFAREVTIAKMLPALDNIDRSLAHLPNKVEELEAWKSGVEKTQKQLASILEQLGVKRITAKSGDAFNPAIHEAVAQGEGDGFKPDTIMEVLEDGYQINGKIVRPVKVKVAK